MLIALFTAPLLIEEAYHSYSQCVNLQNQRINGFRIDCDHQMIAERAWYFSVRIFGTAEAHNVRPLEDRKTNYGFRHTVQIPSEAWKTLELVDKTRSNGNNEL